LRQFFGERFESLSAGAKPAGYVHELAIQSMDEIGINISRQSSKSIDDFFPPDGESPNLIISVCSLAEKACPTFPGNVERLHWPFDDPAHAEGSKEQRLAVFRRVRDEIRSAIQSHFAV